LAAAESRRRGADRRALRSVHAERTSPRTRPALLDALGIDCAHVLGALDGRHDRPSSLAIERPERVLSLTSMIVDRPASPTSARRPRRRSWRSSPPVAGRSRAPYIEASSGQGDDLGVQAATGDRARPGSSRRRKAMTAAFYPEGVGRQLGAILATRLAWPTASAPLAVPTLVIHGRDDTLIAPDGGRNGPPSSSPAARLLMVDDMGHDRPEELLAAPRRGDPRAHRGPRDRLRIVKRIATTPAKRARPPTAHC